jgi:hypothetical protein
MGNVFCRITPVCKVTTLGELHRHAREHVGRSDREKHRENG